MTLPGFVILALVAIIIALIVVELGGLPGRKAREREHPQAEAIQVLGWIGLVTGGVGWVIALVWAYTQPGLLLPADAVSRPQPPEASKDD